MNSSDSSYDAEKDVGYIAHETPNLSQIPIDAVPVYIIPKENGYFPTGYVNNELVSTAGSSPVQLYQIHPSYARHDGNGSTEGEVNFPLIAEGNLVLLDPSPGTPSDVALIGNCGDTVFYVMNDDATVKVSRNTYNLLLPKDCIRIQFAEDVADELLLHVEGLLAARTKFVDKSTESGTTAGGGERGADRHLVPKGRVSQSVYSLSVLMASGIVSVSKKGSEKIRAYGESKRSGVTETKETEIGAGALATASAARKAAGATNKIVGKIGTRISKSIGGALATTIHVTENDSKTKRRGKRYLTASALAFSEVSDAVGEGYDELSVATKNEAAEFIAAKYGREAGDFCRQTVGAAVNFGKAALTVRRILDLKCVIKEGAKVAAAETIKNSTRK